MGVFGPSCSSELGEFGLAELKGRLYPGYSVCCTCLAWQLSQYPLCRWAAAHWDLGQGSVGVGSVGRVVLRYAVLLVLVFKWPRSVVFLASVPSPSFPHVGCHFLVVMSPQYFPPLLFALSRNIMQLLTSSLL